MFLSRPHFWSVKEDSIKYLLYDVLYDALYAFWRKPEIMMKIRYMKYTHENKNRNFIGKFNNFLNTVF